MRKESERYVEYKLLDQLARDSKGRDDAIEAYFDQSLLVESTESDAKCLSIRSLRLNSKKEQKLRIYSKKFELSVPFLKRKLKKQSK
jgi:hypothetical protein